jgi:hypothetical protein
MLGRAHMLRYNDPAEAAKLRKEGSRSPINPSLFGWSSPKVACSSKNLVQTGYVQNIGLNYFSKKLLYFNVI